MHCFRRGWPALCFVLPALAFGLLPGARGDAPPGVFPTVPESEWVGTRFLILPQSRAVQHYGYQELYRDTDKEYVPLPYTEFAGRTARIVRIEQGHGPGGETLDEADLQFEDNKETVHADIDHGCMDDAAPAADLDAARRLYLGRTLWLTSDHLSTYDAAKDVSDAPDAPARQSAFGRVRIKQYSPVKVVDVVPGWYSSAPVRFIVQEEGAAASGYVDVHMSDTNVPESSRAKDRFEDTFLETDPRKLYPWPASVWTAIENKEVFVGMTAAQARLSWGEPKAIRRSASLNPSEQWIYAPGYSLTVTGDVVTKITKL